MLRASTIWLAFGAYLALLLGVACYENRREKKKSARGFLTAGGSITWPFLVMIYLASLMSTWVFFVGPGGYYRGGLAYWLSEMSYIALFPIIAHFTMNKVWMMNRAHGYTTPADFYDDRFHSPVLRVLLALVFRRSHILRACSSPSGRPHRLPPAARWTIRPSLRSRARSLWLTSCSAA